MLFKCWTSVGHQCWTPVLDQCWTPVSCKCSTPVFATSVRHQCSTPVSFKCWTPVLDTSGLNVTSVELQLQVLAKSLLTTALHAGNAQELKPPYFNFWAKWDCCENGASCHLQILNTGFCYFKLDKDVNQSVTLLLFQHERMFEYIRLKDWHKQMSE